MKMPRTRFCFIMLGSMALLLVGGSFLPVAAAPIPLTVPLPSSSDAAYLFFALINEHCLQETLGLMDADMVPNEAAAQAWAVSLNTIATIRVAELQRWKSADWSAGLHNYRVVLHIALIPGATYYGWENGVNIRWLTLQRYGIIWKVHEISTGP